jgi:transposase
MRRERLRARRRVVNTPAVVVFPNSHLNQGSRSVFVYARQGSAMTTSKIYIGIDVAKATIDVGSTERLLLRKVPNTDAGHRQVIELLKGLLVGIIVIESTGIYATALVRALILAGLPVAVVQPGRARHFAKCQNIRAKTDAIDAMMLARFGEATKPRLHTLPAENIERLRALCNRRDQVIEDRVREQNRLEACQDTDIAKQIRKNITRLEKEEKVIDQKIAKAIDEDSILKTKSDLMEQVSGVGIQTIAILLAHLAELGAVNRQQISALAGLAPYDNASGTHDGARHIYGGRERVRQALYMATLAACRFDPQIAEFYQRLKKKGKIEKVARIACARKLLIKLNTILAQAAKPTEPEAAVA